MPEPIHATIVMSRMPRLIEPTAAWVSGVRAVLRHLKDARHTVVYAPQMAGGLIVGRGAERLGIARKVISAEQSLASLIDQSVIDQAELIFALGVRDSGNIHRLLMECLQKRSVAIHIVDLPLLQSTAVRNALLQQGAMLWTPAASALRPFAYTGSDMSVSASRSIGDSNCDTLVSLQSHQHLSADTWLTHTTRACPGPWPGQSEVDYLDSLLEGRADADHSSAGTLHRIVREQLLRASSRMIRGGYQVVSFTAVPLHRLPSLRCFRTHRTRWDFEPYCVCVRESALKNLGARPVIYGDDSTWNTLSDHERPYFQFAQSHRSNAAPIDWTQEQEWRHYGDVDLSSLSASDICLCVPTYTEARSLQRISHWPVTLSP